MRTAGMALAAAAVLVVSGCGGNSFEADDPDGYEACQTYAESAQITDDPLASVGGQLEAAEMASRAETTAVRDAAQRVGGTSWMLDAEAMEAACSDNGVDIP